MDQHMPELPLIDRIKIAAELVVPIVKQMEEELGKEQTQAIVRRGASKQFRSMAGPTGYGSVERGAAEGFRVLDA